MRELNYDANRVEVVGTPPAGPIDPQRLRSLARLLLAHVRRQQPPAAGADRPAPEPPQRLR